MYDFQKEQQRLLKQCNDKDKEIDTENKISGYVLDYLHKTNTEVKENMVKWQNTKDKRTRDTDDKVTSMIEKTNRKKKQLDDLNKE